MGTGGAERAVALAAAGLRARGRDVRILCLERAPAGEGPKADLDIDYVSGVNTSAGPLLKLAALPILAFRLASYVARHKASAVMSHLFRANFVNVLAGILARAPHTSLLVNHTRISRLKREGTQGWINWVLCRLLYPKADLVASVSSGAATECARLLGLRKDRSVTLFDPIDIDAARSAFPGEGSADTIVCTGRLVPLKRFGDLMDAFARVAPDFPRMRLRIIGDGPERARLERNAALSAVAERITFAGRVADPFGAMAGCIVFVSCSETEGFGMAIVEALALGIPVVASDCAYGPREILAPETDPTRLLETGAEMEIASFGILYPVGSVAELAKALRKLLTDRSLRSELARKGPDRAADFSVERAIEAYDRLLFTA
jgi:N-acetylgalactosamine-N,N'-diacetylbacillosaminyl-diphospho-undecaprenol 4-alpha-N-acetylgalactosaminyltransferase